MCKLIHSAETRQGPVSLDSVNKPQPTKVALEKVKIKKGGK